MFVELIHIIALCAYATIEFYQIAGINIFADKDQIYISFESDSIEEAISIQ